MLFNQSDLSVHLLINLSIDIFVFFNFTLSPPLLTAPTWAKSTWPSRGLCAMFSPPTAHTSSVWRTLSDSLRKPKSESASETKASPKRWDKTDPTASVSASRQRYNQTGSSECTCCLNSVFVSLFRIMQISSTLTCGRPGSRGAVCLHLRRARLPSSLKARPSCWTPTPQCWKCSLLKVQKWFFFRGYL